VGAENCVTLCDLGVFTDEGADPVPAQNARTGHSGRWMRAPAVRVLPQRPVQTAGAEPVPLENRIQLVIGRCFVPSCGVRVLVD
jgi:hypothetical protein